MRASACGCVRVVHVCVCGCLCGRASRCVRGHANACMHMRMCCFHVLVCWVNLMQLAGAVEEVDSLRRVLRLALPMVRICQMGLHEGRLFGQTLSQWKPRMLRLALPMVKYVFCFIKKKALRVKENKCFPYTQPSVSTISLTLCTHIPQVQPWKASML